MSRRGQIYPSSPLSCCGKCWTQKRWYFVVAVVFFILLGAGIHIGWDFPLLVQNGHVYFPILFAVALFYTITFYLFTSLSDPGVIPRAQADESVQTEKNNHIDPELGKECVPRLPPPIGIMMQNKNYVLPYCFTCRFYRPPGVSHCKECNVCIQDRDLHYPWINNCVGQLNYRYFCNFLLSCSLLCLITWVGCIVAAYLRWDTYKSEPGYFIAYNIPTLYVGITALMFFVSMFPFWCYQFRLTILGANARRDRRERTDTGDDDLPDEKCDCRNLIRLWCGPVRPPVDWSEPYPKDFYVIEETFYQMNRTELSRDSLAIPRRCIREHIDGLLNDRRGIQNQIEGFRQRNPREPRLSPMRRSSSSSDDRRMRSIEINTRSGLLPPVERFDDSPIPNVESNNRSESSSVGRSDDSSDDLPLFNVKIDNINGSILHVHYFVIQAVSRIDASAFWKKIWKKKVSTIVTIYGIDEDDSFVRYWPNEQGVSIRIDNVYKVKLMESSNRDSYTQNKLRIRKLSRTDLNEANNHKIRMIDHYQITGLTRTGFSTHPALLEIQNKIIDKQKEERLHTYNPRDPECPRPIIIHTNRINDRTTTYLCTDINHRLLLRHNFINVLSVMKILNNQLPIDVANEDVMTNVYTILRHLAE